MDRLAAAGVMFREHFAQGTATRVSLSALMPSRFYGLPLMPNSNQVPYSNPAHLFRGPDAAQISFVKALESAGLKTAAISAHGWTGKHSAFAKEFGEMHDLMTQLEDVDRPLPSAEKVIDVAIQWISENKHRDYFLYVHLMDTHLPHYFDADAQAFFGATSYDGGGFGPAGQMLKAESALSDEDRRYADALYDGSLRYADRHIGRLVEYLRKEHLAEETLIAITADHGEHLFDLPGRRTREGRSVFWHGGAWLDPVARIPLIVHYPKVLKPQEFTSFSEGVDVGPTLLGLLDIPAPPGKVFDGIDLAKVIRGESPPKEFVSMPRNIRTSAYKCLFATADAELLAATEPSPSLLTGELFDLANDPDELTNVFDTQTDTVVELLKLYRGRMMLPYRRFQAAVSSDQPDSAFAISAKFLKAEVSLPKSQGGPLLDGWSRRTRGNEILLVAKNTSAPLAVQFPLPNGHYWVSLSMNGRAIFEIDGQKRELSHRGLVEFGEVDVTDEVFRATIHPLGDQPFGLAYIGFVPPAAQAQDKDAVRQQLERLRALGYVE